MGALRRHQHHDGSEHAREGSWGRRRGRDQGEAVPSRPARRRVERDDPGGRGRARQVRVWRVYFECNKDQAEELLDKQKEDTLKEIAVLNGEINGIEDTLSGLKTQLYGRFGSNINLEETPA